jgi:SAM-dependent methyltransferase
VSDYRELLLGCGHARDKRINPQVGRALPAWQNLVTLDNNPDCKPDVLCELDTLYDWWVSWTKPELRPLLEAPAMSQNNERFRDDIFDEVHAYEVLEHLGYQGNAAMYFNHFSQIWRILKPDGFLCASVPSRYSAWLWGDPSHRRLINEESLSFLDQDNYKQLDGPHPTPMSDFRSIYQCDFRIVERQDNHRQLFFILQAVKPSRVRERIP